MPNRKLTAAERDLAQSVLNRLRADVGELSGGDLDLLFAYRRKIYKELTYDERGTPAIRKALKRAKYQEQKGLCAICGNPLPKRYAVLDRFEAVKGYTAENTRLIHGNCDIATQAERSYT